MKTETKPKPKLPKIPAAPDSRAPALAVEAWPVDRPKPYERNPRRNDAAVEKVAASIREFGWAQPIVVDGDGVIIIGHTRLKAAKKLGLKTVPVLVRADLTPEQVTALRLADNKTAELAEWDEPLLAAELDALVGAVDMEQFGFDLSAPIGTEGQTDEDAVPEPPPEPVSRRGAVYALGRHRLMCGDSTSAEDFARLMGGEKADMVFTDPPYNMNYCGAGFINEQNENVRERIKDIIDFDARSIAFLADGEVANNVFIFTSKDLIKDYLDIFGGWAFNLLCWNKTNTPPMVNNNYFADTEYCLYFHKGKRVWNNGLDPIEIYHKFFVSGMGEGKKDGGDLHPTMKPLRFVENQVRICSNAGGIVCDPFLGSGTTAIACEKTGRVCYGMELDPHYCDVIRKRWAEFVHGEGCDWQTLAPEVDE